MDKFVMTLSKYPGIQVDMDGVVYGTSGMPLKTTNGYVQFKVGGKVIRRRGTELLTEALEEMRLSQDPAQGDNTLVTDRHGIYVDGTFRGRVEYFGTDIIVNGRAYNGGTSRKPFADVYVDETYIWIFPVGHPSIRHLRKDPK